MASADSRHVSASCLSSPATRSFDRSRAASSNMIECTRGRSTIILRLTMVGRLAEMRRKKLGQKRGWLRLSRQNFRFNEPDLCPLPRVTRTSLKGRSLLPPSRKPTCRATLRSSYDSGDANVRLKAAVSVRLYGLMNRHAGKVFPQISASRFVRDLEESFGRRRFVAIIHSPNERYVLVHGDAYDPKCPSDT